MRKVRIGFLLPRYCHKSRSFMPAVVRMAGELGAAAEVVHPADRIVELSKVRVEHDLYVLRHTSSGFSLSLAGALHELGAAIVNPYPVSMALRDKIIASRILQAAGVPTPDTYIASHPSQLLPLLELGPLVVKPYQGAGGHDVRIVRSDVELAEVNCGREPVFAQRYLPNEDRKSTRLNSSHGYISYAVFCLKKKKVQSCIPMDRSETYAIASIFFSSEKPPHQ